MGADGRMPIHRQAQDNKHDGLQISRHLRTTTRACNTSFLGWLGMPQGAYQPAQASMKVGALRRCPLRRPAAEAETPRLWPLSEQ